MHRNLVCDIEVLNISRWVWHAEKLGLSNSWSYRCWWDRITTEPVPLLPFSPLFPLQVHETERILTKWMERVAELRNEYKWLLFFSVPKLLLLYHLLQDQNLAAIVHEISFLFSNTQASWESAVVEVNSRRGEGGIGIEGRETTIYMDFSGCT